MKCEDSQIHLPAYLDDELDVADNLRVRKHLADCADCRQAQRELLALRAVLRKANLYAEPSAALSKRIEAAVRRAAREEVRSSRSPWFEWFPWAPTAAALLVVITIAFFVLNSLRSSHQQVVASAVLVAHIRSLQADHLVDVTSSDRHTVKPWFQGKLDFSPPVPDLSGLGWPLVGARLDYIAGRPVAALVYRRRKHNVNVFLWPNQGAADDAMKQEHAQGYQILHWNGAGIAYWVVSDLSSEELQQLARALHQH